MKKIFALLGASLALSGCFDEPKKESSQPNQSTTSTVTSTASETPSSTSSLASSDKSTAAETSTQVANSSAQSSTSAQSAPSAESGNTKSAGASIDKPESQIPALKTEAKAETKTGTQVASTDSDRTKLDSASDKSSQTQTPAPNNGESQDSKSISAQKTNEKPQDSVKKVKKPTASSGNEAGLSEEEMRVGYQKALSKNEIFYLKQQCRYPFMSDKEMVEYRCETKNVIQP